MLRAGVGGWRFCCLMWRFGLCTPINWRARRRFWPSTPQASPPRCRKPPGKPCLPRRKPPTRGKTALLETLAARDNVWRVTVGAIVALCWALSLLWQLLWRARYLRPRQGARAAMRAITTYRGSMAGIWALNLLGALCVYLVGARLIAGRTVWDTLMYFGSFVLAPLAAMLCSRLAAPPAISGKHAFFRRL